MLVANYKMVEWSTLHCLAEAVQAAIACGWHPHGFIITQVGPEVTQYCQPMVLLVPDEDYEAIMTLAAEMNHRLPDNHKFTASTSNLVCDVCGGKIAVRGFRRFQCENRGGLMSPDPHQ